MDLPLYLKHLNFLKHGIASEIDILYDLSKINYALSICVDSNLRRGFKTNDQLNSIKIYYDYCSLNMEEMTTKKEEDPDGPSYKYIIKGTTESRSVSATQSPSAPAQVPPKNAQRRTSKSGYNWNYSQNKHYLKFLMTHKHIFDLSLLEKKRLKVNVMLSKKIPSRTSTQCHSHHQKMVLKYGNIDNIIWELNKIYNLEFPKAKQSQQKQEETIRTDLTDQLKQEQVQMDDEVGSGLKQQGQPQYFHAQ